MKKLIYVALAAALCVGANAQLTIYNGLNAANVNEGYGDWDGGSNQFGANYGCQAGEVMTNSVGATSVSSVEAQFLGFGGPSGASAVLVMVYNFSGGAAGSLVGQQTVSGYSETDTAGGFTQFGSAYTEEDITANVSISGLVSGNQYLVTIQGQGPNWGYVGANISSGGSNIYGRDYTTMGSGSVFGTTTWTSMTSLGYSQGDLSMKVLGTSAPEPASIAALGLGLVAIVARRRRRA